MHVLITDKGTPWQCHDHHGARSKDLLCNRILNKFGTMHLPHNEEATGMFHAI